MNHQASDQARGSRRHFLAANAMSVSSVALAWLASREVCAEVKKPNLEQQTFDTTPKAPPGEPRAKAMISLWMQGGPSHHDLFDPKPAMAKTTAKPFPVRSSTTTPPKQAQKYSRPRGNSKLAVPAGWSFPN